MSTWHQYQEDVAEFFRSVGFNARTNVTIEGARGRHALDVLVTFRTAGIVATWVVECKQWERAVPKERVLVLDGVVKDVGADRGILVAESGYQAGAIRAAEHGNITLTSLADLYENADEERMRLRSQVTATQSADVARRVSGLWPWTEPQTHRPAFHYSGLLAPASKSFELQMLILPRLLSDALPITLPVGGNLRTARTWDELDDLLTTTFTQLHRQLAPLEAKASMAASKAKAYVERLTELVGELITLGRTLNQAGSVDTARATRFIDMMRAVSHQAEQLREIVPEQVRHHVHAVMRRLIDHTYVLTSVTAPDWDVEHEILTHLLEETTDCLAEYVINVSEESEIALNSEVEAT